MATLTLILAESELELVPTALHRAPAIRQSAQQRGKPPEQLVLDSSYHHAAMHKLQDSDRRGRPDLVHHVLLLALDSRLNASGRLRLLIHTRNDVVIHVDPTARLPRAQARFTGLMEQLLVDHEVRAGERKLLWTERATLADIVRRRAKGEPAVAFDPAGQDADVAKLFGGGRDLTALVGGFPSGRFSSDLRVLVDRTVRLGAAPLTALAAAAEVIVLFGHHQVDAEDRAPR